MRKGYSLLELLTVLAILTLFTTLSAPAFLTFLQNENLRAAARELYGVMQACRMEAITRNRYLGLRFQKRGKELWYALYQDGNGNGIRTEDIRKGVDQLIQPYQPLLFSLKKVHPGIFYEKLPDITSGKPVPNPDDPIKFGVSDICSFSPLGNSSPGTLYLTDGIKRQGAIRLRGVLGGIHLYLYNPEKGWKRIT